MFKNLSTSSRNNALVITTIVVLAVIFSYYFFVHIPTQKEDFHKQNFRTLTNISENTNDILTTTENSAQSKIDTAYVKLLQYQDVFGSQSNYRDQFDGNIPWRNTNKNLALEDLLNKYPDPRLFTEIVKSFLGDSIPNTEIDYVFPLLPAPKAEKKKENNYTLVYKAKDTIQFSFNGEGLASKKEEVRERESCIHIENEIGEEECRLKYGIWVNVQNIIAPLVQKETFEDYFLIKNNEIIAGKKEGILIENLDTLLKKVGGVESSTVSDLSISGQDYKVFSLPFKLSNGEKVVLCGMVPLDKYRQQVMSIPGDVVMLVLLLIFLIALAFPIAKLLLMSKQERLNMSDVVFAGISVVLGTSVFILLIISIYNFYGPGKTTRDGQLNEIGRSIEYRFTEEVKSACFQLKYYDSIVRLYNYDVSKLKGKPLLKQDRSNFANEPLSSWPVLKEGFNSLSMQFNQLDSAISKKTNLKPTIYPFFSNISWVNDDGYQFIKWSANEESTEKLPVTDREYFRAARDSSMWASLDKRLPPFRLESVFSKNTGEYIAVIAMQSIHDSLSVMDYNWWEIDTSSYDKKESYLKLKYPVDKFKTSEVTLSTKLYSVMDPVLPPNYGFCIIDKNGIVMFHSGGAKNLNEKFLENCDNAADLRAAMYSCSNTLVTSKYQNKSYRMNIRPIGKLPLYLVIFHDDVDNKTINTEVLGMTMILTLTYFSFISLLLIILKITQWKRSKLRTSVFIFDWLWPMKSMGPIYRQLFEFILVFVAVLLLFLFPSDSYCSILLTFCMIAFVLLLFYLKINQITSTQLSRREKIKMIFSGHKSYFIGAVFFMLVILNLLAWNDDEGFLVFLLFECIGLLIVGIFLWKENTLLGFKSYQSLNFKESYLLMQIALLIITSMVPVFIFFKISFDQEIKLNIRHGQIYFAQQIIDKSGESLKLFVDKDVRGSKASNELNIYDTAFYHTQVHIGPIRQNDILKDNCSDQAYKNLIRDIHPPFNAIASEEQNLATPNSSGLFSWGELDDNKLFLQNSKLGNPNHMSTRDLSMISIAPSYNLATFSAFSPGVIPTIFTWLELLLFIVLLFAFLRYLFSKIFATDFFDGNEFIPTGIDQDIASFKWKNIFLIGSPSSGKRTWLKQIYGAETKYLVIDLVTLDAEDSTKEILKTTKGYRTIILDHFEYGLNDYNLTMRKLSLLTELMLVREHNIIILSSVHPTTFLEETEKVEKWKNEKDNKDEKMKTAARDSECRYETDKWISLLGDFYKIYFPLQTMVAISEKGSAHGFVQEECRHSPFLLPIANAMTEFIKTLEKNNHTVSEEEIILQIQGMAQAYYDALWNSLSNEEQYTIYDIAQDGLANTRNREVIVMLLNKGILVYDDRLRIMNRSFQNFVLTEVSMESILSIEKNNLPTGRWARIKGPLILILVSMGIFIFATQQETFNRIIAFITTFAAGLPIILKVIGLITSKNSGK